VTSDRLAVFVEPQGEGDLDGGVLAAVSLSRNLHSHRYLTKPKDGRFVFPSPVPDGPILVSKRPAKGPATYGVYSFRPGDKKMRLLFNDPAYHDVQAKSLAPRPQHDGRSSVVDESVPTGKLYCLNASPRGLPESPRIRILEGPPGKIRVLGEFDVEKDGSFHVTVPADIPMRIQALNIEGVALRTCSWIWVRNKENRGCIGCHEDGELVPENVMAEALRKPAIQLTLPPEKRRAFFDWVEDR
jgi:hypothetical protein